jgi:hypothetical protein
MVDHAFSCSLALVVLSGCGSSNEPGSPSNPSSPDNPGMPDDAASFVPSEASVPPPGPMVMGGIYANTLYELYRFDPVQSTLSLVGSFSNCADIATGGVGVMDIAIDSQGNAYATDYGHQLAKLDLKTAACTIVKSTGGYTVNGLMPNESLSFVPKGTLDPNGETLVGFLDAKWENGDFLESYATWDTGIGAYKQVAQNGDFEQISDVVTVKSTSFAIANHLLSSSFPLCDSNTQKFNCVLEVDPKTGKGVHAYGIANTIELITGLAFWAGTLYGFSSEGGVWSIGWQNNQLVTTQIPVSIVNLKFQGAASTPAAPPTLPDGGGIPIH